MKILITGNLGQLGRTLQAILSDHEVHEVIGFDLPETNITEREEVFTAVTQANPDLVIHTAAYTDVDGCARNPALAYKVNGLGTQNVALACLETGAVMMHISTNEVFGGDRLDGYEEWMPMNPCNPYGRSKAAAEFHVRSILSRYYIVRFSWLFAPGGRNFIHNILDRAHETGQLRVVTDEVANPTYVKDAAGAIAQLMETGQYGTYHLGNSGACSRWEFANEILRLAGLEKVVNTPILSKDYKRPSNPPAYAALHNIAGAALGITLRPWAEALAEYMEEHVKRDA